MRGKKFLAVIMLALASVFCLAAFVACGNDGETVEYTVTFDANTGVLDGEATVKVKKGEKIKNAPTASKDDHTFEAWYDAATDGTKIVLETYTVSKDVTLYAHYTPNGSEESVKITLNANGGKFSDNSESKIYTTDKDGLILDADEPTKTDGGELVDIMFDGLTESQTLYAHWIRQYTVTFNANGGELKGATSLKIDQDGKIAGAPTASKSGNDFYGWIAGSATGDVIDLKTYVVKGDVTLYAKYGEYTMPIKTLKKDGQTIGYTIEAEDSKYTVSVPEYLQQWLGNNPVESNVAAASGNKSLGYMTEAGKTVTFTFKAAEAGTAKIYVRVSAGVSQNPNDQSSPVVDVDFGSNHLGVKLNGGAELTYTGVAPGSGEPSKYNTAFSSVLVGEVNLQAGTNTVLLTVKQGAVNLDCLDIETEVALTSVNGDAAKGESTMPAPPAPPVEYSQAVSGKLIVADHAEGPAISKAVLGFTEDVTKEALASCNIKVGSVGNAATDKIYLSDANGVALGDDKTASQYITIEYKYETANGYAANNVKPFSWNQQTNKNSWIPESSYAFSIKELTLGATTYTKYTGTFTAQYDTTDVLANWDTTGTYTDSEITLKYGWYTPAEDAAKTEKKPLIVWLHGAGEGGTDPSIAILGNQVVNLGKPLIQKYFTTDTCAGAYVLAPQSPTMWMDNGNGQQGGNDVGESIYTETLFKLIQNFVDTHTDIDANRVYIGGCSNGAWMTVEMLSKHGEYFAAGYPVAVPFVKDAGMTADEFTRLVNVPMWITHAEADTTVMLGEWEMQEFWGQKYPTAFKAHQEINANSLYIELLKAGATNVHYSLFEKVSIAAGEEDAAEKYDGHYSWIYVLRNECVNVQATTGANGAFGIGDLNNASTEKVNVDGEDVTLWGWIAAQSKTVAAD